MIQRIHATETELRELISSDHDSPKIQALAEHVHVCPECRQSLEAMAAASAIWKKVPVLLKDSHQEMGFDQLGSPSRECDDASCDSLSDDWTRNWPINDLLDSPSHPEMLGRIGRYEVEREIGRGGMGIVVKAYDAELNRPVAIKILAPHLAHHGTARKRFAQEAIAAGGILHPNVISVYGVSNEGKTPFIVMPFVDGPSLQNVVDRDGPMAEIDIVRVALQISSGLAAAHSQGLVHRDIKPANILVDGGVHRVMITDFGLARVEDDASLTRTGWLMGTPNYMSPEQAKGQRADSRSDLFSLGSLMYFLASGRLPFRAESSLGVLHRIQHEEPTPIRQINRQISQTLADVIQKLLKKSPESRFQSAAQLHDLLERQLAYLHQPDLSKPPRIETSTGGQTAKWSLASKVLLVVTMLTISALGYHQFRSLRFGTTDTNGLQSNSMNLQETDDDQVPTLVAVQSQDTKASKQRIRENIASAPKNWIGVHTGETTRDYELFCEADRLYELGRYDESLAGFQKTIAYETVKAKSYYNIACIQVRKGDPDSAFQSLRNAIEFGYIDEQHYMSDPDLELLRKDSRWESIQKRIRELSKAADLLEKAKSEARNDRYESSETLCRQVLELNPNDCDAALQLGYVLHKRNKLDEALAWHQRAANAPSTRSMGHFNLACYYAIKGQTDRAFDHLDNSIRNGLSDCMPAECVKDDSDFASIRNDDRFSKAIVAMERNQKKFPLGVKKP